MPPPLLGPPFERPLSESLDPLLSLKARVGQLSRTIDGLNARLETALHQHERALLNLAGQTVHIPDNREVKDKTFSSIHSLKSSKSSHYIAQQSVTFSSLETVSEAEVTLASSLIEGKRVQGTGCLEDEREDETGQQSGALHTCSGVRMERPPSLHDMGEATFDIDCRVDQVPDYPVLAHRRGVTASLDVFDYAKTLTKMQTAPSVRFVDASSPEEQGRTKASTAPWRPNISKELLSTIKTDDASSDSASVDENSQSKGITTQTQRRRQMRQCTGTGTGFDGKLGEKSVKLNTHWTSLLQKEYYESTDGLVVKIIDCPANELLFRSDFIALDRHEMIQMPLGVLHPFGYRKLVWSFIALTLITYDMFTLPLEVFPIEKNMFFEVVEWTIAVFWTLDIPLSFRTAFFKGADLIITPREIARNYARTWLVPDIFLIIFEWIFRFTSFLDEGGQTGWARFFRALKAMRSLRLVRLVKLPGIFHKIEDIFNYALEKALISVQFVKTAQVLILLIKMTAALIVLIHLVTCGWYFIGDNTEDGWTSYVAVPECGFVKEIEFDSSLGGVTVESDGTVVRSGIIGTAFLYFNAARWVAAQMNGRTDQDSRRNLIEMVYTCIVAVAGPLVLMAVFVSTVTNCMMELSSINSEQKANRITLKQYVKDKQLTPELLASLKEYIKSHKDLQKETESEKQLLEVLTKQLQENLLYEVRGPTVCCHKLFKDLHEEDWKAIKYLCSHDLQPLVVNKDEQVFDRGDMCTRMLFVFGGKYMYNASDKAPFRWNAQASAQFVAPTIANYRKFGSDHDWMDENDISVKFVGKGMWLSEAAIWLEWRNRGYLVGVEPGGVFTLEAKQFSEHVQKYAEPFKICLQYAKAFAKAMTDNLESDTFSDLMHIELYFMNRDSIRSGSSYSETESTNKRKSWGILPTRSIAPGKRASLFPAWPLSRKSRAVALGTQR